MIRRGSALFLAISLLLPVVSTAEVIPACGGIAAIRATDKEVTAAQGKMKIGDWTCPIAQAGVTADVGEAKQFLVSRIGDTNSCKVQRVTPQMAIDGLNSAFATCAARFFKEYESRYTTKVRITRASNPIQCEAELCRGNSGCGGYMNSPAPNSNHVKGVALDVTNANQRQMMLFAKQNPQFGVCFPFLDHPRFKDDVHMILAGINSGEARLNGCTGVTKACDGVTFNPNEIRDVTPVASPTSNFSDSIRQIFGMQPAQPAMAAQQAVPSQQLATTQSPLSSFGGSLATPLVSDSLVTTETVATTSNSIADRLNELLNTPTTTSSQSSTSVPLVINSNDVATVVSHQNTNQTSGIASIGGGMPQNTFSGSAPISSNTAPSTLTRYQSILSSLKTALEMLLAYVRPFGRGQQQMQPSEYQTY